MNAQQDLDLLAAIRGGDEDAMMAFYDRHYGLVAGYCRRLVGDAPTAEEAIQDTFLQVWRLAATYDPARARPTTWLFVLARTRCLDALRRSGRRASLEVLLPAAGDEDSGDAMFESAATGASGPDPTGQAAARRLEGHGLRRALAALPTAQRQALQAAYMLGLSASEIATAQGVPLGTVKTRIRLGLRHLRGVLEVEHHAP